MQLDIQSNARVTATDTSWFSPPQPVAAPRGGRGGRRRAALREGAKGWRRDQEGRLPTLSKSVCKDRGSAIEMCLAVGLKFLDWTTFDAAPQVHSPLLDRNCSRCIAIDSCTMMRTNAGSLGLSRRREEKVLGGEVCDEGLLPLLGLLGPLKLQKSISGVAARIALVAHNSRRHSPE